MKFVNKVLDFLKGLLPGKSDKTNNEKDFSELLEGEGNKDSAFKTFALKSVKFVYKYLKKFVIFILGLLFTMAQPMIKIAKKHPIAFWTAIILHAVLLFGLLYSNIDRWEVTQIKPSISQPAPVEAIVIDIEIIEAEKERLKDLEKQKQQKLKEQEERSESAQQSQKVAEQEALKAKAKKVMAEVQRKAEEAKTKEAEVKRKAEEAKAKEASKQKEEAEVKRKAEEAKAKEASKQKEEAEVKRKAEEAKAKEAS
ncbi:hypothetical protein OAK82_05735 [Candidatus Thioglobus sp.]|nr:hypothetical protein [Candidatus Thioglobus sp.]